MKKLLNTLYVTTEGAALRKDGENLVAEVEGMERARVPFHMLSSLVVFGGIFISPPLIEALAPSGVTIVLLDRVGRFRARVEGPVSGNVVLRRAQYRASDNPEAIVVGFVSGKIANQRAVLQRGLRDHGEAMAAGRRAALEAALERLARILRRVASRPSISTRCAAPRGRRRRSISRPSTRSSASTTQRSASPCAAAAPRSTRSTRCSPSSTPSSLMTAAAPRKPSGSIPPSASCIASGRGVPPSPST